MLYTVDNSAIVAGFDLESGKRLWERGLGTLQKGSPVLADGKLYVGTENGKFYILQPVRQGHRGAGRGLARLAGEARGDYRLADRRGRPRVRDVDGSDVCDWQARAAAGRCEAAPADRSSAAPAADAAAPPAFVQIFPYDSLVGSGHRSRRSG